MGGGDMDIFDPCRKLILRWHFYMFVLQINVPVGNVQVNKADLSEIPRCECKPDQENPCSSDTECLNRMLMYECSPAVCPAKEACGNQRFQKRQYPESTPYRTESRGWGLKTLVDIKKVSSLPGIGSPRD